MRSGVLAGFVVQSGNVIVERMVLDDRVKFEEMIELAHREMEA